MQLRLFDVQLPLKFFLRMKRLALLAGAFASLLFSARAATTNNITVLITPQPVNIISPQDVIGAGVDAIYGVSTATVYSPSNMAQMLAAGYGSLSYRLNTELGVQDWHWNPSGTWSDATGGGRGYFTGSASTNAPLILHSYPFELPHRGHSFDQTGPNTRYSRLVDDSVTTYWKSNPYLTSAFTGEPDSAHPQWAMLDFGSLKLVSAAIIAWGDPYATSFKIQYWQTDTNISTAGGDPINYPTNGTWVTFPFGNITNGTGGSLTVSLTAAPATVKISTRYVRVLMTASSSTCDDHGSGDPRNCVGYAIRELYFGQLLNDNSYFDYVNHAADPNNQMATYVSSVDPWHSNTNITSGTEQPGLDYIYTNGITRGLPAMLPVSLLYGTPSNAVAEIAYCKARGYPISYVELGEEPDGQYMTPEDYGALYVQWAAALHALDPALKLGGPAFQEGRNDVKTWTDANGENSWLKRFINYLTARGRLGELGFMSFEHYAFDPCSSAASAILQEPNIVSNIMAAWRADGVPTNVPIFCTEFNYSSDYSGNTPQLAGGLWLADFIGSYFANGGDGAWFYQYEPLPVTRALACNTYGTFSMFTVDAANQVSNRTAQFFASQLVNQQWLQTNRLAHYIYAAHSDLVDVSNQELITAYAALRPDGQWAVMLINKDTAATHFARVQFSNTVTHAVMPFTGAGDYYSFAAAQYVWHSASATANGFANPDLPPVYTLTNVMASKPVLLAKSSLNVLRGAGPALPGLNSTRGFTNGFLTLDYFKPNAATGVTFSTEIATNIAGAWLTGAQFVEETILASNATVRQVHARDLISKSNSPAGFLKLKISVP
jgi:hypothetical protein